MHRPSTTPGAGWLGPATASADPVSTAETAPLPPTRALLFLLARLLTFGALVAMFTMSPALLLAMGLPYGSPGGPQLAKIHPASFLALGAVVCFLMARRPVPTIARLWHDHPGLMVYVVAIAVLMFQAVVVQHKPVTPLIDTFLTSALTFVALTSTTERDRRLMMVAVHVFFTVNSGIAYLEQVTSFRLLPTYLGNELVTFEWRSTALLGHPLVNAAQTGLYLVLLSGPAGRVFDPRLRILLVLFQLGAMTCFGGRTATILSIGVLLLRLGSGALVGLGGARTARTTASAAAAIATVAVLAGVVLVEHGALDRFLGRFQNDAGSAATRVAMLHVFDRITPEAFVLAPDPADIAAAQRRLDITTAIESFVVAFPAYYGLLVSGLFFVGLALFLAEIVRLVGRPAVIPLAFLMAVNAGANGISTKTLDLSLAFASVYLTTLPLRRREGGAADETASPPESPALAVTVAPAPAPLRPTGAPATGWREAVARRRLEVAPLG
nr:VpsF family polysaccharide biosynthesis protein [Oharaeibacter diazotrophicus]